MTQPPDDRPRQPEEPEGDGAPENAPTVAWTPPDSGAEKPPEEGGVGWAAVPEGSETTPGAQPPRDPATPPEPATPTEPAAPAPPPAAPVPPAAEPGGPIISATPTPPTPGWQTPALGTPGVPPAAAPGGGWEVPAAAGPMPQREGYVIAGVGARIVAWLIDILLAGIIPVALTLALVDWAAIISDAVEQARLDPSGRVTGTTYEIPITLDYILATLIGVGISFLYFVGFWTSRWQSTPGMIGLKMRVVDAATGGTLTVLQATKRWIALGWPLALLVLVPALQNVSGLAQFALSIFLFFTTVTNDRRQGLHDKWAGSLVIRSVTSGNGATFVGCLVWGVLVILLLSVAFGLFFAAAWPELEQLIRETNPNAI